MTFVPEEGGACFIEKCPGKYRFVSDGDCSCHISPPCSACTGAYLQCDTCDHTPEVEDD